MPIYEYICRSCKHEFEELRRSMGNSDDVRCPACRSRAVERRLSVFTAHRGNSPSTAPPIEACARCGDPDGPCPLRGDM